MIKNMFKLTAVVLLLAGSLVACENDKTGKDDNDNEDLTTGNISGEDEDDLTTGNTSEDDDEYIATINISGECFIYNFDEKIYLTRRMDKIFLKFSPDANTEQISALINRDASLQLIDGTYHEGMDCAGLESKDGKPIPVKTVASYKADVMVVSATYILEYNGTFQGLMDDMMVKLKETTSYAQLEELAAQNNCKIGKEDPFRKEYIMIYVSKTSKLDAMQMAWLFYETGLFEYAVPNFAILNAWLH